MTKEKNKFQLTEKYVPFILLLITVGAYIPLINQLGFYWDDWPMLWFKVTKGAEGFATAFDSDRPFLGYLYQLTNHMAGSDSLLSLDSYRSILVGSEAIMAGAKSGSFLDQHIARCISRF